MAGAKPIPLNDADVAGIDGEAIVKGTLGPGGLLEQHQRNPPEIRILH